MVSALEAEQQLQQRYCLCSYVFTLRERHFCLLRVRSFLALLLLLVFIFCSCFRAEGTSPINVLGSPGATIFPGHFSALVLPGRKGKDAVTVTNTCKVSSNYCLEKSNICCKQRTNCGGRERKWRLLECKWNRCPDALGKRSFPLQIRALNYKAFTNENSCGKSSALICVMASVTGD